MNLQRGSASPFFVAIGLGLVVAACSSDPLGPGNEGTTATTAGVGGASSTAHTAVGVGGASSTAHTAVGVGGASSTAHTVVGVGGAETTVTTAGAGGAETTVTTAGVGGDPGTTTAASTTGTTTSTTSTGTGGVVSCTPMSIPPTDKLTSTRYFLNPTGATPNEESNWSSLAFDSEKGEMVMFGGRSTFKQQNLPYDKVGTWSWSGSAWAQLAGAAASPSARTGFALVYDKQRKKTLLFGGESSSSTSQHLPLNDTWLWDGQSWHAAVVNGPLPPARSNYAISYDSDTATILLHGGHGAGLNVLGDTWSWDGSGWTNVTPTGAVPTARAFHSMAYDPIRKRTVLFGGSGWSGAPSVGLDVWEWDGGAWKKVGLPASNSPPGGANTVLLFDPSRGRVLSYGGTDTSYSPPEEYAEFHAWDGAAWSQIFPVGVGVPPYGYSQDSAASAHYWAVAYDDCRNRIVLFRHIKTFSGATVFEFGTTGHQNHAPVFLTTGAQVQIYPGDSQSFTVEATDADIDDTLIYSASSLPTGSTLYPAGSNNPAGFSWSPSAAQAGEYAVTFTASDGTATTDLTVPIHVGAITYADLPTSMSVNVSVSATFAMSYCNYINDICTQSKTVTGVTAVCTFTGTNPGRVMSSCTVSIPAFQSFDQFGSSTTVGPYVETVSKPVKGDRTFQPYTPQIKFLGQLQSGPSAAIAVLQIEEGGGSFFANVHLN